MVLGMAATLTISDAARASGVTAHTPRYYERAGYWTRSIAPPAATAATPRRTSRGSRS